MLDALVRAAGPGQLDLVVAALLDLLATTVGGAAVVEAGADVRVRHERAGGPVVAGQVRRQLGADRRLGGVRAGRHALGEQAPRARHVEHAVALRVRRDAGDRLGRGVDGPAQRGRGDALAGRLGGRQQQRGGAGGLRGGHRGAVEHLVARRQRVARLRHRAARLPGRRGGDGRAGGGDVRLEAAVLTRAARGEVEQRVVLADHRAVVGQPGLLADARRDAHHVGGDRRVADGVQARAGVAGRDEQLHAVVVDQLVVEDRAGVVAVVERGQAADRHVHHVDLAVDDQVGHAVGERGGGAAATPRAGAGGDQLGARGGAVEVAVAEHVVGGGDAGDVGAVRCSR